MEENKLNAVRKYLSSEFPGDTLEEKYDFDRGAQTFKIHHQKEALLLKVDENFLADSNEDQITTVLQNQEISKLLKDNKELGVFVGNLGANIFKRFV